MKEKRYNFFKDVHLDVLVSKDPFRPQMKCILFEDGKAIASDAHTIVVVPLYEISNLTKEDIEKLNGHLLLGDKFKIINRFKKITNIDENGITVANNDDYSLFVKFYTDESINSYPKYKRVIEELDTEKEVKHIKIKYDFLNNICYGLGLDCPEFTFYGENKPIRISFYNTGVTALMTTMMID